MQRGGHRQAEVAYLESLGVELTLGTKMERLVEDASGRIVGAEVRKKYKFGQENSGTLAYIKAKKAVVLGAGGFSQDVPMRAIHEPRLTDSFASTNHQGATGEALREALKHKAMDVHMD